MHNEYLPELAALISAGPIVVYTCEAFGEFSTTSITPNITEQLGYQPEEFLNQSDFWASKLHPDDRDRTIENINAVFEKGIHSHEYQFSHKDGTYRWIRDDLRLIVDDDGQPVTIVGYRTDITENKILEIERQESETRFRDLVESMSDWFWEQDAEFKFTNVSAFNENRFINRSNDAIGHTRWGLMDIDPEENDYWRSHIEDLIAHRSFRDFRYNAIDADGKEHVFSVNGKPVFNENRVFTGYRGTVADITELSEATNANERLLLALDHLSVGLALWDAKGRLISWNEALRKISGAADVDLLPGMTYREWQKAHLRHGVIPEAVGREDAWLAERMAYFHNPIDSFEILRAGRWHLFRLQKLPDGSTMHSVFDIQNTKENEQRFKDFSDIGSDWLWETDENHKFTFISIQYGERIGVPVDLIIGKTIHEASPQNVDKAVWTSLIKDMSTQKELRDVTQSRILRNGDTIWVTINGKAIFGETGKFRGYRGTASEITERVIAEEELRESEKRFKDFSNVSSDWFWESDVEHRMSFLSGTIFNHDSFDPKFYYGRTRLEFIGEDNIARDPEMWHAHEEDLDAHRPFQNFKYSIKDASGTLRYLKISGQPIADQSGRFIGYRGTGTDITKEVEATNEMHRVERLLYNAIEVMEDGFVLFDADDRLVICNQRYKDIYYEIAETLVPGVTFTEIIDAAAEARQSFDSLENIATWVVDRMEQHANPAGPIDQELMRGRWVRVIEQKTAEGGIVGLRIDVTKEKQEHEELRKLSHALEQSPSMVFITDAKGNIEYVNSMFTKISGYTADEVIGKNPRILKSGATPATVYAELWQTIESGDEWRGELQDRRKDGLTFWAYATISPVKDESGEITHFVSMHEDISERKKVELLESQARQQAEMANRAKSELLANMSHELRTPLNAIIGFSHMFRDQLFGPLGHEKYDEYAIDISNSGQHLLTLINDILDVSAIESGKLELSKEYIDVSTVIEASVRMVSNRAKDGDITLRSDINDRIPKLYGDDRRIKQILINLLNNAVKFTEPGGDVSVEATFAATGDIIFKVIDTGIGMNDMELAKAMEQFGQVESSHTRKYEGSGLGLPLTIGLVNLHDGRFDIKSKKGKGTTVTVTFPQDQAAT